MFDFLEVNVMEAEMTRYEELIKLCESLDESTQKIIGRVIHEIAFLEDQLDNLRQLPFIEVNPKNISQQRPTPAAKQYKEFLQQYNNCIKIILSALCKIDTTETSPLREYLQKMRMRK